MTAPTIAFTPQTRDLALYAGDGAAIRLTVTNLDTTPVDLTGTVTAHIRRHRGDTASAAEFAVDATDAATGIILLQLSGAQTSGLLDGENTMHGAWDVQWHPDGAEPITLLQGAVKCGLDVTRP